MVRRWVRRVGKVDGVEDEFVDIVGGGTVGVGLGSEEEEGDESERYYRMRVRIVV